MAGLVLSRRVDEAVILLGPDGQTLRVTVAGIEWNRGRYPRARLLIQAPSEWRIWRDDQLRQAREAQAMQP